MSNTGAGQLQLQSNAIGRGCRARSRLEAAQLALQCRSLISAMSRGPEPAAAAMAEPTIDRVAIDEVQISNRGSESRTPTLVNLNLVITTGS